MVSGCSDKNTEPSADLPITTENVALAKTQGSALTFKEGATFDFGALLARDQILTHTFVISNPTNKPIALTSAISWTPCCSKVLPVTGPIPAKGLGQVVVEFKPGFQTGKRQLAFEVRTDEADSPRLSFALTAELTSSLDVKLAPSSDRVLLLGRKGRQLFEVVCRKVGNEGRGSLESVDVGFPHSATFAGPAVTNRSPTGVVESTRSVEITLAASSTVGSNRAELVLRWSMGPVPVKISNGESPRSSARHPRV